MSLDSTPARQDNQPSATAVSATRMMADLQRLAHWTKVAATPTEAESLAFVSSRFAEAGFSTETIWHEAYISVPGDAHVMHGNKRLTAITHSMAVSSPTAGLTAEVIDVGDGEEIDFAGKDVAGRIVMVDGIAVPATVLRASRAGAAGVVHVTTTRNAARSSSISRDCGTATTA